MSLGRWLRPQGTWTQSSEYKQEKARDDALRLQSQHQGGRDVFQGVAGQERTLSKKEGNSDWQHLGSDIATAPPSRLSSEDNARVTGSCCQTVLCGAQDPNFCWPPMPFTYLSSSHPPPPPLCSVLFDVTMCSALCCHSWDSPKMFSINWGKCSHYFLLS